MASCKCFPWQLPSWSRELIKLSQGAVLPWHCLPPPGAGKCHWGPRLGLCVVYLYYKEDNLSGLPRVQLFVFVGFVAIGPQVSQNDLELARDDLEVMILLTAPLWC